MRELMNTDVQEIDEMNTKDKPDFDRLFREAKGKPVEINGRSLIRLDRLKMAKKQMTFRCSFVKTDSEWRQGFALKTKGFFRMEGFHDINKPVVFWEDDALEKEFDVTVISDSKELLIYNAWDLGDGVMHYWHNGAAMEVKVEGNTRTYYCNDGYPDTDFDDLVFKIEFLDT